jgi:phage terminase small subunit
MPKTFKEKRFVNEYLKTGNATEAASRVYNVKNRISANAIGSENLAKLSFDLILDKAGVTDDFIAKTIRRGMKAKRTVSVSNTNRDADANTNDFIDVPDWTNRLKATELASKAKGHLKDKVEHSGNINVIPLLGGQSNVPSNDGNQETPQANQTN